jgi:hypothetical protein
MIIRNDLRTLLGAVPIIGFAYLTGLLLNDILFDVSQNEIVTRAYYCELINSFSTPFGVLRILGPASLSGIMQLYILFRVRDREILKIQALVLSHLVLVGVPLMCVSLSLCQRECSRVAGVNDWSIRSEVFTIHMLMLALFIFSLWGQVKISFSSTLQS